MTDFDFDTIAPTFDEHVRGELPWYELATDMVAHLVRAYLPAAGVVLDIGCATGNIGRALAPLLQERFATLIPMDSSPGMVEAYKGPGFPLLADISLLDIGDYRADVIVSFLTMMFVPPARRKATLAKIMHSLNVGGALILFERFESPGGYEGTTLQRLCWSGKLAQGVKAEDIVTKELSLSGVQRPLSYDEVPGNTATRCFQFGDFAGFICRRA